MKKCKVCGASSEETRIIGELCRKHYLQMWRHGKVIDRTIYDPNEIIVIGETAKILLYNTKGIEVGSTLIDSADVLRVSNIKWYLRKGYVRGTYQGGKVFLHRFLTDAPEHLFVDHINGDPLDNRKGNLRHCSHKQNIRNMRKEGKKIKGVSLTKTGKWSARICVDYETIWLGVYDTREEAEHVRLAAELEYFKEFSPNFK